MSVYLEIHCDTATARTRERPCRTFVGNNPRMLTSNEKMLEGFASLERGAKLDGWKKIRGRWTCPECRREK